MIREVNSPVYGKYFIDYCVRFNVEILRQVGIDKYIKVDDAFRKVFCGLYTLSLIEQTETNFDFLMGWPFQDINQEYSYPEKKWKKFITTFLTGKNYFDSFITHYIIKVANRQ